MWLQRRCSRLFADCEPHLEKMLEEAVALFPGTIAAVSELIAASWSIIFVGGLGIVLVLFRNFFFDNADTLKQEAVAIATVVNAAVDMLNVVAVSLESVIDAVAGLVSLFDKSSGIKPFQVRTIPFMNSTSFAQACVDLPRECASVDSAARLFQVALTPIASEATCGFFRYIYPVQWLFELLYPVAEALALTYPPYPPGTGPAEFRGQNCTCPASYGCSFVWECALLGSGIWILEFIFPLVLLGAIWNGVGARVASLAVAVVEEVLGLTWNVGVTTIEVVEKGVSFIAEETVEGAVEATEAIDLAGKQD